MVRKVRDTIAERPTLTREKCKALLIGPLYEAGELAYFQGARFIAHEWRYFASALLPLFLAANHGKRPYVWWLLDAPGVRLRTDVSDWTFGIVDSARESENHFGRGRLQYDKPPFESQAAFLQRHNLMSADEIAAFKSRCESDPDYEQSDDCDISQILSQIPETKKEQE